MSTLMEVAHAIINKTSLDAIWRLAPLLQSLHNILEYCPSSRDVFREVHGFETTIEILVRSGSYKSTPTVSSDSFMSIIVKIFELLLVATNKSSPGNRLHVREAIKVSERSERASRKTSILAMNPAKWLQPPTSTTKLTHSIILTRSPPPCSIKNAHNLASLGAVPNDFICSAGHRYFRR